jgi:hypothetical protein
VIQTRLSNVHAAVRQITAHAVAASLKAVGTELLVLDKRSLNGS